MQNYDIVWDSQSKNSAGSMPVGGYDIGANVWVESGELMLYVDRSGSFDENNQMLKLGRLRMKLEPSPFGEHFCQRLCLERGSVIVEGDRGLRLEIWCNVDSPMLHIEMRADGDMSMTVTYESWRTEPRLVSQTHSAAPFSYNGYPGEVYTWPDIIEPDSERLLFSHHNKNDKLLFDFLVEQQGLEAVKEELMNPQKDFIFGGMMTGDGLNYLGEVHGEYAAVPYTGYRYGVRPAREHHIDIGFHMGQMNAAQWVSELEALCAEHKSRTSARGDALSWWREFWSQSYIDINLQLGEADEGYRIARNYALFRYMLGCNARGEYPTKFNGGLFTTDAMFAVDESFAGETPDYRCWGGGSFTAQNQRLVYWPMLKSGDFDMMVPQFNFYMRALGNAELRTKAYWGHDGCSFTEQVENMGLPVGVCWGFEGAEGHFGRPEFWEPFELRCPWIRYEYQTQLEFAYMMIQYGRYTGADISRMMPFIESSVEFFQEHYELIRSATLQESLDENGHWTIFPSTALETYKNALNPTDVVAALRAVIEGLCQVSEGDRLEHYKSMLAKVPPVAIREREGVNCIAPAWSWSGIINHELPQLYPVFPYEQYGIGMAELELARNTYWHGVDKNSQRGHESWRQDGIFAARLGLADEAQRIAKQKLGDGPLRFPAFWGPGYDWLPDHNWGGSGMIGLQDMLAQWVDGRVYLFPAWPMEWCVSFKLHLPIRTVVDASWDGAEYSWNIESDADITVVLPDGTEHQESVRCKEGGVTK